MAQIMTNNGEMSINDILNNYFGFGGGAGGGAGKGTSGTAQGTAQGIGAIGSAILGTIIGQKAKDKYLPTPGTQGKTEEKTEEKTDVITPGLEGIKTDFEQYGKLELPYLPNAIQKEQTLPIQKEQTLPLEKEETIPTIPPISEGLPNTEPSIKDETDTNIENAISPGFDMQSMYDFILQQQQRQWEREDAIRKETQEREDNAWQRSVDDMRKAGINPNLINPTAAQSGGGITQATGLDYSPWTAEINKQLALVEQEIENNFKGDENSKDRLTKGLTSLLQLFTMFALKG